MASKATPRIGVRFVGHEENTTLTVRPVGLMAVERRWGGTAFEEHPIEAMLFGAFVSLGNPGVDFDAWVGTIEEVADDDEATADPSSATPSDPSPPSQ